MNLEAEINRRQRFMGGGYGASLELDMEAVIDGECRYTRRP